MITVPGWGQVVSAMADTHSKRRESPSRTIYGTSLGVGAICLAAALVGTEIAELEEWSAATSPQFVGEMVIQLGTVVGAYFGGRLGRGR